MESDALWIVIPNWRRFQHYEARNPIWVKTYTELLSADQYLDLPPRTRSLLHGLWLLYASSSCAVRAHTRRLSRALNQQVTRSDLDALVDAGFIELSASKPLAEREAPASKTLALARADAGSQDEEAEEEREPLPNGQSGSSTRSAETAPPRAAKRAATAQGTNLTQNGSVATDVLAAYEAAARWLRSGGATENDWRYRVEVDFGVTDDIELAGLADLQQQLAGQEQHA